MHRLWNETRRIERFLRGRLSPKAMNATKQEQLTDAAFAERIRLQEQSYKIIRQAGRRQLKRELKKLEHELLKQKPMLKQQIDAIFR